jgi:NAD(P)-dependent dehydrogenase (short-subunit alcohol dehydrogenase family)
MMRVLLTGVTGAIGHATVLNLAKAGKCELILCGRSIEALEHFKQRLKDEFQFDSTEIFEIDFSSRTSVSSGVDAITERIKHIDVIVNLAAVYRRSKQVTKEGLEVMYATNFLGPALFTESLTRRLNNPVKVITVSSASASSIDFSNLNGEKRFSSIANFSQAKTCLMIYAFHLSQRFENTPSCSFCFDPGIVISKAMNEMPALIRFIGRIIGKPPEAASYMLTQLILADDNRQLNGKFFGKDGKQMRINKKLLNKQMQDQIIDQMN